MLLCVRVDTLGEGVRARLESSWPVKGLVDVTMARSHARRGEKERLVKSCLTNSSTQDEVEARRQNRFLVANG